MFHGNEVSVVIPTHNRPKQAINAIESIRDQSVSVGEITVVNDGSEQSYSSVERYLEDLSIKTQYIETNGVGAAAARNLGAELCDGKVFMFLDDDDKWRENKVGNQLERISQDVGLVYSGRIVVDESGNELYRINGGPTGDLSSKILIQNLIGTTSSPAIRADIFNDVGGFDEEMPGLQDWELWIRLCQKTLVDYDSAYTVEWLSHSKNTQMTSQPERYINAVKNIQRKHSDYYNELNFISMKKAKSNQYLSIAKKYGDTSVDKYWYILMSLLKYPSITAAARILPEELINKIR